MEDPEQVEELWRAAGEVLDGNWTGTVTLPSRRQYPHQWSWDTAFIAVGLAHWAPERGRAELAALFRGQSASGRLPHIVFDPAAAEDAYFPGPAFWRRTSGGVATSGLVQPPVHARAVLTLARHDAEAADFLHLAYPALTAFHRYLATRRDAGGGLAAIVHPWESGLDNSPAWDPFLEGITGRPSAPFVRRDQRHVAAAERPTDDDYRRYVYLAERYRDTGYDDARLAGEHPFLVEDPMFNAILLDGELCLAEIAERTGRDPRPHNDAAERIHDALTARLWDPDAGCFTARDARTGERSRVATVGGLVPLLDPWLGAGTVERLAARLDSAGFAGGCRYPVPSADLRDPAAGRRRYWRGPTWVNTNWLVWQGARRAGLDGLAARVAEATVALVARAGFREYFDPVDGTGLGAGAFSWSAALTLDMLARSPARAVSAPPA